MHIHRQGGGVGVVGETALLAADLGERHAEATQLFRHCHEQVARLTQLFEVLVEEPVFAVIDGGALRAPGQNVLRQHVTLGCDHGQPPFFANFNISIGATMALAALDGH